jgi:hypothetical protein
VDDAARIGDERQRDDYVADQDVENLVDAAIEFLLRRRRCLRLLGRALHESENDHDAREDHVEADLAENRHAGRQMQQEADEIDDVCPESHGFRPGS